MYDWKIHLEQNLEEHKRNGSKEGEVRKEWKDLYTMTIFINYNFNISSPVITKAMN